MKLVVLGATGGTGREVVSQALAAGHDVVACVRRPEAVEARDRLTVVRWTLDDVGSLTGALEGADALVCCLGARDPLDFVRGNLIRRAMTTAVAAMAATGVRRLVLESALGASDTASITPVSLGVPARTLLRANYTDKDKAEDVLSAADLDTRIAYPAFLTNGPATDTARTQPVSPDLRLPSLPRVARADVAAVLLELAESDDPPATRVVIT